MLAHELAHVAHRDVAVMTMASSWALALAWLARTLAKGGAWAVGGLRADPLSDLGWLLAAAAVVATPTTALVSAVAHLPLRALSRYRELAADRTAAVWLGQPALLASVLVTVHGEHHGIPDADLRANGVPAIGFVARPSRFGGWFSTHPSLARRLSQLDAFASQARP